MGAICSSYQFSLTWWWPRFIQLLVMHFLYFPVTFTIQLYQWNLSILLFSMPSHVHSSWQETRLLTLTNNRSLQLSCFNMQTGNRTIKDSEMEMQMSHMTRMNVKNSTEAPKWFLGKRYSCNHKAAGHFSSLPPTDCPVMELLSSQIAMYNPTQKRQATWPTEN
jgi:hypothetical protein